MKPRILVPVALAAVGVLGLAEIVQAHMEVVRAGRLLPSTGEHVQEVRFFDAVSLYVRPELKGPGDLANSFLLAMSAGVCLIVALLLRRRAGARRPALFFGACSAGAGCLALDDVFGIHETLAYNLAFLASTPGDPADVVFACGAIAAVAFLILCRDVVRASGRAAGLIGAAIVLLAGVFVCDAASIQGEEAVEVLTSLTFLAGIAMLGLHHLTHDEQPAPQRALEPHLPAVAEAAPAST